MKLFIAVLFVAAVAADKLENVYLPPGSAKTAGGSGSFLGTPKGAAPSGPGAFGAAARGGHQGQAQASYSGSAQGQASYSGSAQGQASYSGSAQGQAYSGPTAAPIEILRFNAENNGDGKYNYDFETENHIQQQESGQLKNAGSEGETIEAQGSFTFTAPDGQTFSIQYVADENGFQPQGAHIPTAPPVPEEILKALEQNAADEAAGIVDDGQYRPDPSEGIAGKLQGANKGYNANAQQQNAGYNGNAQQQNAGYKY